MQGWTKKIAFTGVVTVAVFLLLVLYGYSRRGIDTSFYEEFGFFPFYRSGTAYDNMVYAEEETIGIVIDGLIKTIASTVGILTVVFIAWRKLIRSPRERLRMKTRKR